MFSTLRNRFGIPGVISVMALVFAMFGGAYAASNSSDGGKATASAKAKKGPRGPKGPKGDTGPAGPQGPAGPAGAAGPKGDTGAAGSNGTNGTNGTNGQSVTITPYLGPECEGAEGEEGAKFTNTTGTAYACNGAASGGGGGFAETLPAGKTETGTWRFISSGAAEQFLPISFPIPLSSADAAQVTMEALSKGAPSTAHCPGSAEEPSAEPGYLCVYTAASFTTYTGEPVDSYKPLSADEEKTGVITSGTYLYFENAAADLTAGGSFAVTAPEA